MNFDKYHILFSSLIVFVLVVLVLIIVGLIMKHSLINHMGACIKRLESIVSSNKDVMRVALESKKIKNHFNLLLILFIKECNFIRENNLSANMRVLVINDLISAWVDSKTGILTLNNSQMTSKLIPLIAADFEYILIGELWKGHYNYGDDHAFEFDNEGGTKIYLSNNDFLKDFIKSMKSFDAGHKAFFN